MSKSSSLTTEICVPTCASPSTFLERIPELQEVEDDVAGRRDDPGLLQFGDAHLLERLAVAVGGEIEDVRRVLDVDLDDVLDCVLAVALVDEQGLRTGRGQVRDEDLV